MENDNVIQETVHGEYKLLKLIGKGSFGKVYSAQLLNSDSQLVFAVKVVEKNVLDEFTQELLNNEVEAMSHVSMHPGIVTLCDSFETETTFCFVLEHIQGGTLVDRIIGSGYFSESDAQWVVRPLLKTLKFMKVLEVVHRDIKPENLLVDPHSLNWPVKLSDFGLSSKLHKQELTGIVGTPFFIAPEILSDKPYDCSCDMWSLGIVLYLILCGYPPFFFEDTPTLFREIMKGQVEFPEAEWASVSADAMDLIMRMLDVNPRTRITADEAFAHPWLNMRRSTSKLKNDQLKIFNARRKMRSSVAALHAYNGFKSIASNPWAMPKLAGAEQSHVVAQALSYLFTEDESMAIEGSRSWSAAAQHRKAGEPYSAPPIQTLQHGWGTFEQKAQPNQARVDGTKFKVGFSSLSNIPTSRPVERKEPETVFTPADNEDETDPFIREEDDDLFNSVSNLELSSVSDLAQRLGASEMERTSGFQTRRRSSLMFSDNRKRTSVTALVSEVDAALAASVQTGHLDCGTSGTPDEKFSVDNQYVPLPSSQFSKSIVESSQRNTTVKTPEKPPNVLQPLRKRSGILSGQGDGNTYHALGLNQHERSKIGLDVALSIPAGQSASNRHEVQDLSNAREKTLPKRPVAPSSIKFAKLNLS
uniref:Protein kinase domain-containing protein n=1 Tax=Timspurckia oligopyrenoides TaxID=708627 RepID=A0A7S0ZFE4_9RHOD|mmetsp:Transcript_3198/g.5623  ORF Transcript_3198/g.5623 Transcript_3198/m.5623 type:complete len:644 (+) Transcript_3198:182-2113(+)|eukprot:CAMPEP_0182448208 /NCGR_PEP_ID=MMETSP1172-20130603/24836_1 /TAXON_ID=708627 /ORGANISM="Timspurckia oligopyrenoides, Strain CCMP3278" /LENGTH=643 /DNA_ID=CAMNT_0024644987 /DNA_START=151 /DNA_END=2082 /DNA_ORIENTATION=+